MGNTNLSARSNHGGSTLSSTDLDAGAGQVDVGSPLALHPAVLGRPGVHYRRLAVGGAAFSLGYVLVGPGAAAGDCLRLLPARGKRNGGNNEAR